MRIQDDPEFKAGMVQAEQNTAASAGYGREYGLILKALQSDISRAETAIKSEEFSLAELAFTDASARCRQLTRITNKIADRP